jgi:hypothetical protein
VNRVAKQNQSVGAVSRKDFPVLIEKILLAAWVLATLEGCHSASVSASTPANTDVDPGATATAANANGQERQSPVVAPAGSVLRVRLDQTLNTRYSRPGDRFSGVLDAPLFADGSEVLPKGTVVGGHVLTTHQSGRLKGQAVLSIALDFCRLSDGDLPVSVSPLTRVSAPHRTRDRAPIVGGADSLVGGLAAGPLGTAAGTASRAVAVGKDDISFPAESVAGFTLRNPLIVNIADSRIPVAKGAE